MKRPSRKTAERRRAVETISMLEQRSVYIECPHGKSDKPIQLKDCGLFYGDEFTDAAFDIYEETLQGRSERIRELQIRMKQIPERSEQGAERVNTGLMWERLAPCMDGFCFDKRDCRSLFDPVDYIVFEGLQNNNVTRVLFLEIKTGGSRLRPIQRQLQGLVGLKRVSMQLYAGLRKSNAE